MRSKQRSTKGSNGENAIPWSELRKELNLSPEGLLLAEVKLDLSILMYDLRKAKKMSQKKLAQAIGVSQPYIAKIEDGEENLTLETIVKLLAALNICLKLKPEKRNGRGSVLHILKAA